jgi:hypothetical protein
MKEIPDDARPDCANTKRTDPQDIFIFRIFYDDLVNDKKGIYKLVMDGLNSHAQATGFFKIVAP